MESNKNYKAHYTNELIYKIKKIHISQSQTSGYQRGNVGGSDKLGGWNEHIHTTICINWASLVAQMIKHLPAMQETWVRSLGQGEPLEKEMATHSSILAWKIAWTEEPSGLKSLGSQRVGYNGAIEHTRLL